MILTACVINYFLILIVGRSVHASTVSHHIWRVVFTACVNITFSQSWQKLRANLKPQTTRDLKISSIWATCTLIAHHPFKITSVALALINVVGSSFCCLSDLLTVQLSVILPT